MLGLDKRMILEKPSATVSISNSISALQRKFYDVLLYNAKETLKKDPGKTLFRITLNELKSFLDVKDRKNRYLKSKIKELMKIVVEYNLLEKDKERWGAFVLLPSVDIETKDNTVTITYELPDMVRKALLGERSRIYAKIDLIIVKGLKSKYAIVLYELIKDYENTEIPKIDIEKFRSLFGVSDKYTLFVDLRRRVIDVAVQELNSNANVEFQVDYVLEKVGPKYRYIKFIKKKKPKKDNNIREGLKELLELINDEYRERKSIQNMLERYLKRKGFEYCERNIRYTNQHAKDNYTAFLSKALKEDWALGWWEDKLQKEEKEKWYEKIKNAILKDEKGIEYKTNESGFIYLKKIDDRFVCLRDGVTPPPIVVDLVKKGKLKIVGNY